MGRTLCTQLTANYPAICHWNILKQLTPGFNRDICNMNEYIYDFVIKKNNNLADLKKTQKKKKNMQ